MGLTIRKPTQQVFTRRQALGQLGMLSTIGVSKALFPAWMPRMAFRSRTSQGARGDILIAIFLRGGWDALNVVVPFGEGANYYDRRPSLAIATPSNGDNTAIDLNGFFGLHPALRPLKDIYDRQALAVVHAVGSPNPTRSHFDAMDYMERGTPMEKSTPTGWIGRHLETAAWQNDSPFRAVGMGALVPTSLRGSVSPLALQSIADFHLRGERQQLAAIQQTLADLYAMPSTPELLQHQAAEVFSTIELLQNMAVADYQPANGATYPDTEYGMGLQQIAQLIKADVGLEVACVDLGGWDTHQDQGNVDGNMANHLRQFAQGLAAFYADMQEYMSNIIVTAMSEFGRRATENASFGTDHGHGSCMFVMGDGIQGGVYSQWPTLAEDKLDDGDLAVTTDYRDVLSEIVQIRLQNPAIDRIFPDYTPNKLGLARPR